MSTREFQNTWGKSNRTLEGKTDESSVIARDFNIPASVSDRTSRQKNKNRGELINTNNQTGSVIIDIYRLLHPTKGKIHILLKVTKNIHQADISGAIKHTLQIQKKRNYTKIAFRTQQK